jgi:hypothetical protein
MDGIAEFEAQLRAHGLMPSEVVPDDRQAKERKRRVQVVSGRAGRLV